MQRIGALIVLWLGYVTGLTVDLIGASIGRWYAGSAGLAALSVYLFIMVIWEVLWPSDRRDSSS